MSDEQMRRDWRRATLQCPRGGQDCPSPDELQARLRGIDLGDRNACVISALSQCARCAGIAQVGGALVAALPPAVAGQPIQQPQPKWLRKTATAASILLCFGGLGWLALNALRPEDTLRAAKHTAYPVDGSVVSELPTFTWQASGSCEFEIRDTEGTLHVHKANVTDSRYRPTQPLAPGSYLWTVRCLAQSMGPYRFELQP